MYCQLELMLSKGFLCVDLHLVKACLTAHSMQSFEEHVAV